MVKRFGPIIVNKGRVDLLLPFGYWVGCYWRNKYFSGGNEDRELFFVYFWPVHFIWRKS